MARGNKADALAAWDKKYVWHPFTQQADWVKEEPVVVESARGWHFKDTRGRRYLDGVSSLWVNVHGHGEPALNAALRRQLKKMAHVTFLGLTHEPAVRLARELVRLAPRGLTRVFYSDNGSTAVEVAMKMAFQYGAQREGHVRRSEFFALANSYHGDTLGSVSVGGIGLFHKRFRPLLFKTHFGLSPSCPRCPFNRLKKTNCLYPLRGKRTGVLPKPGDLRRETGCRWECLASAEKIFRARRDRLAAAVVEPAVQAAAGMLVMPPGYLRGLERLCRRYGVLLIADEVATGFGRTGTMFAVQHEGVRPDLMCVSKSITGGTLPLAATLAREEIYRAFLGRYEEFKTFFHGHTYTANPLACAAALANLRLYRTRRLLRRLTPRIRLLRSWLEGVASLPAVGSVRQIGLMAGVELVRKKNGMRPFPPELKMGQRVCRAARAGGLWIRPLSDIIVILPPLALPAPMFRRMLGVIRESIRQTVPPAERPL